jgi:hypothetical protein
VTTDLGHRVEDSRTLVSRVVEVRAYSDADIWPVVDREPSRKQLVVDMLSVAGIDCHVSPAVSRVER